MMHTQLISKAKDQPNDFANPAEETQLMSSSYGWAFVGSNDRESQS